MAGLVSCFSVSHELVTSSSVSSPASVMSLASALSPSSLMSCSPALSPSPSLTPFSGDYAEHRFCSTSTAFASRRLADSTSPPSTPSSMSSSDGFFDSDNLSLLCNSSVEDGQTTSKTSPGSRLQRNQAEKQRRDKLNICIGKLAAMVPLISQSTKRINKSGILRLTASYLRLHQRLLTGLQMQSSWRPPFSGGDELGGMLLESIEGFMVIIDQSGRILFVSDGIEKFLGHAVVDVLGQPFRTLVHPDDQGLLDNSFETLFANQCENIAESDAPRCSFFCSLAWNSEHSSGPSTSYELFNVAGHLKCVPTKRQGIGEEVNSGQCNSASVPEVEKVFVGLAKLCSKMPWQRVFSSVGANEVVFRSCLNSRVTFVDQNLCGILGLLPSELIGLSGYGIIFQEDFPLAAMAHSQMLSDGSFSRLPIRLHSRFASVIYVLSSGRLVSSVPNGEKDTIFVHCTVLSLEDGEKALAVARSRITPYAGKSDVRLVADLVLSSSTDDMVVSTGIKERLFPVPEHPPPKRPRGRPRKYPVATSVAAAVSEAPVSTIFGRSSAYARDPDFEEMSGRATYQYNYPISSIVEMQNPGHVTDPHQLSDFQSDAVMSKMAEDFVTGQSFTDL